MTVRSRRRALSGRAQGRVLDLGGADSHRSLFDTVPAVTDVVRVHDTDAALDRLVAQGATFDTVLSVFAMASAVDLPALLARLRSLLDEDGYILFLEPTRQVRFAARLQAIAALPVAVSLGWHPNRNITQSLRTAQLSVVELQHHRLRTTQWWVRAIDEGAAHHQRRPRR